jgi:hypothetical protein
MIDKFTTVIAVELQNGEGDGSFDVREGLKGPGMGVIEEGTKFHPARGDIGGGQSMDILAERGLSAMMNRVDLPETGLFPLLAGVKGYGFSENKGGW